MPHLLLARRGVRPFCAANLGAVHVMLTSLDSVRKSCKTSCQYLCPHAATPCKHGLSEYASHGINRARQVPNLWALILCGDHEVRHVPLGRPGVDKLLSLGSWVSLLAIVMSVNGIWQASCAV